MEPEIILHLARADNGIIGDAGALPWRIPADLKRFKCQTMGKPLIMGRKTCETLPALLPGRRHIVLTRSRQWRREGVETAGSVEAAMAMADGSPQIAIIGGAEIYRLFLPHADRIELTEVHFAATGDTLLEPFDRATWKEVARDHHRAVGDTPAYSFVTLERQT
jgi:dihydrofolate reductase